MLLMGFGMIMDPMRWGIAAILMMRRQAIRNLLAYWLGGMVAGISVGIAVLVFMHDVALVAIQNIVSTMNGLRSAAGFDGGRLQITFGVMALLFLAVLVARQRARVGTPVGVGMGGGDASRLAPQSSKSSVFARLAAHTQGMLESGGGWPSFVAGLASTCPPIEGPIVLTVIMASKSELGTQFSAFVVFILLVLVFIEIPLVSYFAAPEKTQALMLHLNAWIHAHRSQILQTSLAVTGVMFLVQGVGRL